MKDQAKKIKLSDIDLKKNSTYCVKNGELIEIPIPSDGFGTQIISWQGGVPSTVKIDAVIKI